MKGLTLLFQANSISGNEPNAQADTLRAESSVELNLFRDYAQSALVDPTIDPEEKSTLEFLLCEALYFEDDLTGCAAALSNYAEKYSNEPICWARGMLWLGIAKARMNPPDLAGAAEAFDAVLAANVTEFQLIDHLPTIAAYWRTWVAMEQKDRTTATLMMTKLRDQMPDGPRKDKALASYGHLLE